MNISKYIEAARKQSHNSKLSEWSIGAVIVQGGKVVSKGFNRNSARSEWMANRYGMDLYSLHAEMDAIQQAPTGSLQGAVIFVAGFKTKNGNRINTKPCSKCMKIIRHVGIRAVCYESKGGIEWEEEGGDYGNPSPCRAARVRRRAPGANSSPGGGETCQRRAGRVALSQPTRGPRPGNAEKEGER